MKIGEIVLVRFPFTGLDATKKRPALVLRRLRHTEKIQLVTLAMITSQVDGFKLDGDVHLEDWKESGLLHPSLVRLGKIATLDSHLVERSLGKLTAADAKAVRRQFTALFEPWIA